MFHTSTGHKKRLFSKSRTESPDFSDFSWPHLQKAYLFVRKNSGACTLKVGIKHAPPYRVCMSVSMRMLLLLRAAYSSSTPRVSRLGDDVYRKLLYGAGATIG